MLPSQNLLNVADFKVLHQPANGILVGYEASARVDTKNKPACSLRWPRPSELTSVGRSTSIVASRS